MKAQLLLLLLLCSTAVALTCQSYIENLAQLYNTDKEEFAKEVHGYVAFSGKIVDDLGLPNSCVKNSTYHYFTGRIDASGEQNEYIAYLGLCFSAICSTEDMDRNGAFIINTLLNITSFESSSVSFSQPELESQMSAGAVVFITLFAVLIAIGMKESVVAMFKGCQKEAGHDDEELVSKYAVQYMDDYDPTLLVINQKDGFFKRQCLVAKFTEYWVPEENSKIMAFSLIRILSLPLALYGYLFYLCNLGSYNYFSFNEQIYQETFSKIALTAYYLPDILFFISGYLFASKAFMIVELESKPWRSMMSLFSKKFFKLYVLYWVFVIIYWQISPSLHGGPVWSEYEGEAGQCSSSWWRVFLLIDNWFDQGCYNFAWFIPAEMQLSLINIVLLLLYARNRKLGLVSLGLSLLSSWILVLTISSPLPSSLQTTLDYDAQKYFKSTYSHLPFYLLGVSDAYLVHNQTTKTFINRFAQNRILRIVALFLGSFFIILVAWRPEVWDQILGFELGLARTGMFIGIYLIIFGEIYSGRTQKTLIHRFSSLSLGALLLGGIVVSSSFWCNFSFPYLDSQFLLTQTIPNTIISFIFGGFILILMLPRPPKQEETLL